MDPRRPSSPGERVRVAIVRVVVAAGLLPVGLAACGPPTDPPSPVAASERAAVTAEVTGEEAPTAADVLDRLASARTGRTSQVWATYLESGTGTGDADVGREPALTVRVDAEFDRDAAVLQGRSTSEVHDDADQLIGAWAATYPDGGMSFEVYLTGDRQQEVFARIVQGDPLGGPVPGPWRRVDVLVDDLPLDDELRGADDLLELLQAAAEASPPAAVGEGRWRGSVPPELVVASEPSLGPITKTAMLAHVVPADVIGDAIRYELADLGAGRVEAVLWLDADDISVRLGEEPGGAPLSRFAVEWFDLDLPVELWGADVAAAGAAP